MNPARHARAVAQARAPTFAWPQVELRRWGAQALLFLFCLASGLLLTASRLEITRLRYELSDLDRQRQGLAADVARLRVQAAALASPRRIEALARELGYAFPDGESVVVLDE